MSTMREILNSSPIINCSFEAVKKMMTENFQLPLDTDDIDNIKHAEWM